jgi:two-component system, cell cycle sensor histidine kinase and response regulator CckA
MSDSLSNRQELLDENVKLKQKITDLEQSVADLRKELRALRGEEALRVCEEKFASIFHSSPSAIGITTLEERRFLDINENFLQELGYERDEVVGKKAEDLRIWADPSQAIEFQREITEKGVVKNREYQFLDKGGKIHRAITSAALIAIDGQRCILTQNLDITVYKEAEEELQKLASIVRHSGELINLATPDGQMSFLNEAGCKMLGIHAHKINENNIMDVIPEGLHPLVQKDILPVLLGGSSWEGELQYRNLETGGLTDVYAMTFAIRNPAARIPLLFANVSRDITVQKRAIVALRESESFRRRIFESSRTPIVIMDAETLRYIDCNPAATEIYRFASREETLGKTPKDVSAPVQYDRTPSAEKALFFINKARTEGMAVFEWRHQRPDGEIWDAQVHLMSFQAGGRHFLQFTLQDITERKKAEDALRERDERLQSIFDNADEIIHMIAWDGTFLALSPSWEHYTGYSVAESVGKSFVPYVHPDDAPACLDVVRYVYETGLPRKIMEFRVRHASGKWIWFMNSGVSVKDEKGTPLYFLGVATDITARKQVEERLVLIQKAVESSSDAIGLSDPEGRHIYHNKAFTKLFGYTPEELSAIGEGPAVYADKNVGRQVFESIMQGVSWAGEAEFVSRNGSIFTAMLRADAVRDERGKVIGLLGLHTDITEIKRTREERMNLQMQLNQAQKMESVGRLAGGIAHDFNNMLGVILGHAEIAMMKSDPGQPLYADMQEIRKAAERSADLTRQLLAFARRQTATPKVLDLDETVEGMLKMLRRLIGENIELIWRPGKSLWTVKMDPSQLDQILANLCINSRDAIAGVGRIIIETRPVVIDEAYCSTHSGVAPGQYVLVCVSDDGSGMDRETLDKLFEPFFTTKAVGQGTGLGLATVYGIVKQNNGFINVYSEPGKGTSFSIYLPRRQGEKRQVKLEDQETNFISGTETILLAEDEPAILEMTAHMLERFGYTVLAAVSPKEAIRKAKEHQGAIHLLITDVVMPGMNGRDLAQNIMNLYPDMRCLFMSGYTADIIAHQGVLNEGVHFIQKPFSMSKLADKVREALA